VPTTLNSIQEAAFVAHGRVELETVTTLVASSANVVACLVLLQRGGSVATLLTAFVIIECIVTVVYFVLIQRCIAPLPLRLDLRLARRLAREIRAFAASSLLAALFARPELLILSVLASEREVGLYGAALKVADLALMVPQVAMTNVFPLLSAAAVAAGSRFRDLQRTAVRGLLAYAVPVTAALLLLADPIVRLLYGAEFGGAALPLRILALGLAGAALAELGWRALAARGAQHVVVQVQVVTIATRLGAGCVLVASWAAAGAAAAAAAGAVLGAALLFAALHRRSQGAADGLAVAAAAMSSRGASS
jgi:O-antigen/teichoic acid export membrane protein